jgi:hypothetical protein
MPEQQGVSIMELLLRGDGQGFNFLLTYSQNPARARTPTYSLSPAISQVAARRSPGMVLYSAVFQGDERWRDRGIPNYAGKPCRHLSAASKPPD